MIAFVSGRVAEIAPDAAVVHVVRDPRAATASMLLGRRRRTDIYPDADTFFTARTGRRLWSSRRLSEALIARGAADLPADIPDFLRPLLVWQAAFRAMEADGTRLFGDRYALVRLEDVREDPRREFERIYGLGGRELPEPVADWISANIRREFEVRHGEDPRWERAVRLLGMEEEVERAGYGEILELEPGEPQDLDLTPPPQGSRLAGFMGRARQRARKLERR